MEPQDGVEYLQAMSGDAGFTKMLGYFRETLSIVRGLIGERDADEFASRLEALEKELRHFGSPTFGDIPSTDPVRSASPSFWNRGNRGAQEQTNTGCCRII